MKRLSRFFILLFLSSAIHAQQNLDSAETLLSQNLTYGDRVSTLDYLRRGTKDPILEIEYAEEILRMIKGKDSTNLEISCLGSLGFSYKQLGDYIKATEYFYAQASAANENSLALEESQALANLATTYNIVKDFEKAGELLKQSLAIAFELNDSATIHPGLINIGNNYYYRSLYDSSLFYLENSIHYAEGDPYEDYYNAYSKGTASLALAKLGRLDSAEALLEESILVWKKYGDYYPIAECLIDIAGTYFDYQLTEKALEYVTEGYELTEEKQFQQFKRDGAQLLSSIYKDKNQLDSAMYYQTIYYQTKDSIQNIESVKRAEIERANFEISKKQTEVDLLETQKRAREQFLLGMGIIVLLLIIGTFIVFRSLQLQRRLGNELAKQKTKLEQLNNAKDKLFSIVSHDLRGPIIAFRGVASMIQMGVKNDDSEMLTEVAHEVKTSSIKLNDMLENLLSWAMQEQDLMEPNPEDILISDLFADLEGVYYQQAKGKQIELKFGATDLLKVHADKNATATIFRNLLNNAIKFTPEQGFIELQAVRKQTQIEIRIKDTGLGMSQEKVDSLFNFQSGKASFGTAGEKGLGLGLNLVYSLTQANKGKVHVESQINEGTTFTITLPAA